MVVRTDLFPDELIAAIDNWQSGSEGKAQKAQRLRALTRHLPATYRAAPQTVFRQIRINAQLSVGIALDAIPETVSSWTLSLEVAQRFRENHLDATKVMVIFARRPAPDDVILNLDAVYEDGDFIDTANAAAFRLGREFRGIARWKGTQKEVVLDETVIGNDEIVSLGAFRKLSDIAPMLGEPDPNAPPDDQLFRYLTGRRVDEHFWTSPESAAIGIRNAADRMRTFLAEKRLWPTERPDEMIFFS